MVANHDSRNYKKHSRKHPLNVLEYSMFGISKMLNMFQKPDI